MQPNAPLARQDFSASVRARRPQRAAAMRAFIVPPVSSHQHRTPAFALPASSALRAHCTRSCAQPAPFSRWQVLPPWRSVFPALLAPFARRLGWCPPPGFVRRASTAHRSRPWEALPARLSVWSARSVMHAPKGPPSPYLVKRAHFRRRLRRPIACPAPWVFSARPLPKHRQCARRGASAPTPRLCL
jgi:hypothetical protein